MDGDAVDGEQLHRHRMVRLVIDELEIPAQAARARGDAPDLAIRRRDRNGRELLAVDGHVPFPAGVVVAVVRRVVLARA